MIGKIYAGILVDSVRLGGFRAGKGCVYQIFTLRQIGEKAREKERRVNVGFIYVENAYDKVNRELYGKCQDVLM